MDVWVLSDLNLETFVYYQSWNHLMITLFKLWEFTKVKKLFPKTLFWLWGLETAKNSCQFRGKLFKKYPFSLLFYWYDYDCWLICPESTIQYTPQGFRSPKWNCKATEIVGGMGEVGGGRLAMPAGSTSGGGTPAERRQQILETTLQAVKRCQVSIIAIRSLITRKTS